jgi:hypothetical protein
MVEDQTPKSRMKKIIIWLGSINGKVMTTLLNAENLSPNGSIDTEVKGN